MELALREIRASEMEHPRLAPNLFPDAGRYPDILDLADYVKERLVELATAKQLCLTDIMLQPVRVREAAGMIILGQRWEKKADRLQQVVNPAEVTPEILDRYMVRIRSLPREARDSKGEPVLDKDGKPVMLPPKPIEWSKGPQPIRTRKWIYNGEKSSMDARVPICEDVIVTTDKTEIDLPIKYAWHVLKQHGKYVRKAVTDAARALEWLYEEVPPETYAPESLTPRDEKKPRSRTRVEYQP